MNELKSKACNKNILFIIFTILQITCIVLVIYNLLNRYIQSKADRNIRQELIYTYKQEKSVKQEGEKIYTKIDKLAELQKINSDIVALIQIEGTNINYPVLQTTNNSYYMTHNYKKEKSKDGSLFLDMSYNWKRPSTNLLIYGHNNIGSREMFVDLVKYKNESFYKTHKIIKFTTNEEEAQYEIISVFLSKVYYQDETDVFRYYYFINADNKREFDIFINNCKKTSLYEIKTTAEYGDSLMTLSTCEYSKINGRLAVVAKKITE